jgi:hypothetical protein
MAFNLSLTTAPEPGRSIHYRRRRAYALWVFLLLSSAGAWALWERPLAVVSAALEVRLRIREAPRDTRVQVWAGPWSRWAGPATFDGSPIQVDLLPDGTASLPVFHIPIARRRWVKGYIPRGTWDLMMLRFSPPDGPPRYFVLPLSQDIRVGLLRPRSKLMTTISCSWAALKPEAAPPEQKP